MQKFFCLVSMFFMILSTVLALTVASSQPIERNIVYIHVPSAICSLLCFAILFFCSIQYLWKEEQQWDFKAAASAEVGMVFATVLNITGMIFAKAQWNVWWTPSPRLISSAVLWFLYIAYLILRAGLAEQYRKEKLFAVFGIIAFVDVPLVLISARFVRDIHQPKITFQSPWQYVTFFLAVLGTIISALILIYIRTEILKTRTRIETALAKEETNF